MKRKMVFYQSVSHIVTPYHRMENFLPFSFLIDVDLLTIIFHLSDFFSLLKMILYSLNYFKVNDSNQIKMKTYVSTVQDK